MKTSQFIGLLSLILVTGCGLDESRNSNSVNLESSTQKLSEEHDSLGVGGKNASVSSVQSPMSVSDLQKKEIDSYIRFKQSNGVECSGVISYEPQIGTSSGLVDVYLYTALHCLQETNALGYLKNASPKFPNHSPTA